MCFLLCNSPASQFRQRGITQKKAFNIDDLVYYATVHVHGDCYGVFLTSLSVLEFMYHGMLRTLIDDNLKRT